MIVTVCCEQTAPWCLLYLPLLATAGALEQPLLIAEADALYVYIYSKSTYSCALQRWSWLQCRRHDLSQGKLSCVAEAPIHLQDNPRRRSSITHYLQGTNLDQIIILFFLLIRRSSSDYELYSPSYLKLWFKFLLFLPIIKFELEV